MDARTLFACSECVSGHLGIPRRQGGEVGGSNGIGPASKGSARLHRGLRDCAASTRRADGPHGRHGSLGVWSSRNVGGDAARSCVPKGDRAPPTPHGRKPAQWPAIIRPASTTTPARATTPAWTAARPSTAGLVLVPAAVAVSWQRRVQYLFLKVLLLLLLLVPALDQALLTPLLQHAVCHLARGLFFCGLFGLQGFL